MWILKMRKKDLAFQKDKSYTDVNKKVTETEKVDKPDGNIVGNSPIREREKKYVLDDKKVREKERGRVARSIKI